MRPSSRTDYETRIHRVLAYIDSHIADDLSLERLARVAYLSPAHFHRIFRALTGESVAGYVQRRRLERAARALDVTPSAKVLGVALAHGYENASAFSRAFRARFGMSATQWRRAEGSARRARLLASRRGRSEHSKIGTDRDRATWQKMTMGQRSLVPRTNRGPRIEVLPRMFALARSYVGPYRPEHLTRTWSELLARADELGLIDKDTACIGIRYDESAVTEPGLCRYDACVVVPEGTNGKNLAAVQVGGGTYLTFSFVGTPDQVEPAWDDVYARLPASGHVPASAPNLEWYPPLGVIDPEQPRFRCKLCVAVQ